jgi:hypothetical protein
MVGHLGFSSGRIGKTTGRKIKRTAEMERGNKSLRETVDGETKKPPLDLKIFPTNRGAGNYLSILSIILK